MNPTRSRPTERANTHVMSSRRIGSAPTLKTPARSSKAEATAVPASRVHHVRPTVRIADPDRPTGSCLGEPPPGHGVVADELPNRRITGCPRCASKSAALLSATAAGSTRPGDQPAGSPRS